MRLAHVRRLHFVHVLKSARERGSGKSEAEASESGESLRYGASIINICY